MVTAGGDDGRARRDPYAAVGVATRAAIDRAARCWNLTELDYRVLLAVVYLLSSWSRLEDHVGARQVAAIVYGVGHEDVKGGQRERVARSLAKLGREGVLVVDAGKGRWHRTVVRLPSCSHEDTLPPTERDATTTRSDPERAPAASSTCLDSDVNVSPPRGHSEDVSEDSSPEIARVVDLSTAAQVREAIESVATRFPSLRKTLETHRRLRQTLTAQINAGWPADLLVNQIVQLSLDGLDFPAAALASRVEKLGDPPPSPASRLELERQAATDHGSTVARTEGMTEETIREMVTNEWRYRDRPELQRSFLIGAGINPDAEPQT